MPAVSLARLARMHGRQRPPVMTKLREDPRYMRALHAIAGIGRRDGELPLA
jgi:beta-N-acetylhexosaminidase